ncbi:HTH_38 domain-containing protein [Trichonephila clavipes]|nr:HTH_38 domain-containing protein [Trichonephila clavipes]
MHEVRRTNVVDCLYLKVPLYVRQIVRMAVTDCSVTSRTIAHHIESVMPHSVSTLTIRSRLQKSGLSARRPLLGLRLTQNHIRLRPNGVMKDGCGLQNAMKLSLLTSHASVCNTTMVGFESGDTVKRACKTATLRTATLVLNRVSLSHSYSTQCFYFKQPALHLQGVGASCPSLPSGLGHSYILAG